MKSIMAGIFVALIIVLSAVFMLRVNTQPTTPIIASNVTVINGQQIVDIKVRGGYQPQISVVKAGMPTILRFETNATFDCSSTVRIPSFGIEKNLPSSGATEITLGALQPGTLQGTCGMGMYRFTIDARG